MKVSILALALGVAAVKGSDISFDDVSSDHTRAMSVMQLKEAWWNLHEDEIGEPQSRLSVKGAKVECTNGFAVAGGVRYPCDKVNFLSLIGRGELQRTRQEFRDRTFRMSDIWGWQSPNTGKEYTLSCMTNVMWFVDSTDPVNPKPLAWMDSHRAESSWCDTKVYQNTAYVVQDRSQSGGEDRGVQVVDLFRLESAAIANSPQPIRIEPDFTYREHGASHNLVVDTDSGFLYSVGNSGGQNCRGGLHMIDISNRLNPTFAGCASSDGYTHDAQCVVYSGPDTRFTGKQICFAYNEDTITIWDVTVKSNPVILSKIGYGTSRYTHQGWLNTDQDFVVMNDELDEQGGTVGNTRSYIVDVSDLKSPRFTGFFDHGVRSIDHNLYFFGDIHKRGWGGNPPMANPPNPDYMYCSNYNSGLRIVDTTNIKQSNPQLSLAGFFDVSPSSSGNTFLGAWSAYMHPSGAIAVNVIETGLMFLEFEDAFSARKLPNTPVDRDGDEEGDRPAVESDSNGWATGFFVVLVAAVLGFVGYETYKRKQKTSVEGVEEDAERGEKTVALENLNKSRVDNPMFETEKL